jgi:hypothetical protein
MRPNEHFQNIELVKLSGSRKSGEMAVVDLLRTTRPDGWLICRLIET